MVPTEELKHDFFDNLMGVPQVLPGIKNGNYTRKTVLFWHLLPRFTSFYPLRHVSLTNCLTTPLSDSLLLQAFQKGGLQKLTKVDTFRGGGGEQRKCRVSSVECRVNGHDRKLCGPPVDGGHPAPVRPDAKAPGRVAPPSELLSRLNCQRAMPVYGTSRNRLKRAGLCHLFSATQNDCHRRVPPSQGNIEAGCQACSSILPCWVAL